VCSTGRACTLRLLLGCCSGSGSAVTELNPAHCKMCLTVTRLSCHGTVT
jgi:hypothetical protein